MSSAPPSSAAVAVAAPACHVHKFGGSSVADAARYRAVPPLIDDGASARLVVVSAMQGVTDALVELAAAARAGRALEPALSSLSQRHLDAAAELDPDGRHRVAQALRRELAALHAQLDRLVVGRWPEEQAQRIAAALPGLGEVLSSYLMHAALGGDAAGWQRLDAREVLVVHPGEMGVAVDWDASRARLRDWRARHPGDRIVVTGYVARDADGEATTLGRNGSDYSAAIFAHLFDADALTIWTDVDGVLSADPRLVPDAVCLPSMSYAEACELAYFGAKVLHPQTLAPVQQRGIPLRIRNARNPQAPGTLISTTPSADGAPVKGLSLVHDLAVLELIGNGMVGVPGTAERLFGALRGAGVSVTMISQGSSEHSICCVVRADQAQRGREAIVAAFADAMADGQAQEVSVTPDVCVLAAVGDGMVGTPGVAARLLGGLAQARVNVRAIAQGAGERNISVAIGARDATRALRAAHSAFWLSPQCVSVGLIGPGKVGRALLAQLAAAQPRFEHDSRLELRLRAIADSRRMQLSAKAMPPQDAVATLESGEALDLERFAAHVRAEHLPHALIVDCSGSDAVAAYYPQWLAAGIHVVTPNKQAGAGPLARYEAIRAATRNGGGKFRYEATVGAGLPVIQTLRSLLDTGDELTEVEGILSGTLAWLFNRYDGSAAFSELVREAHRLGYTEPDPRDDLSGTDVARKLVILAREAGRPLSLEQVDVESLVPDALRTVSKDEFMARLDELDAPLKQRFDAARAAGLGLRYLARLDRDGRASVGVVSPPPGHASMHGALTDNLIQFRTRRYADNPLVVQGPGAGPDVTAAGVFGDILSIAQTLGARA
ncbi:MULTISPECIES: bifunctional aspartate kinase/homoserine dehydrogenase I [unclassified Lysobacter]|uniref:bifunctional aspartate kinase/homoserine dehydrogenase I n=1 Tax=unclassified Lysobacter TaxID=2635362 RepID=UPI000700B2E0|nr:MULTISPECIES: bifunctional aspartate kinase/homoserine dehydrogenase I [unclassified Lysobacter]KQZ63574.1 aspartate kinase [Lysobacter sp. Root559]KRC36464.1 aspartate kinase [Lysobacter sp. Root76]KRD64794.1 aspartate kinase [Lysobacter sp. Root96]